MTQTVKHKRITKNGVELNVYVNGVIFNVNKNRVLQQTITRHGYKKVFLNKKSFYVHRLVAEAFLGASDKSVNHIDGDKTNNNIDNIEYVTASINMYHAWAHGLQPKRVKRKILKGMGICSLAKACFGYDGGWAYNKIKELVKNEKYNEIQRLLGEASI